ncbi:class I SAM-dependent methyltransferase [Christiangramia sabulilitoris]|uniref:Class I SAM-dependent methyltransferase n=1 Tax=Christiangramia sabulilitoris TaxID=2583991 RepID=A0A550HYV6_9FLAO|nr:class I SAM-dependent methyltransferase [Christiangramia sabulilitoris]TRO63897.1 class I SAM-dependent methyltransferase [Christiangramia sabulilitoris]
MKDQASVNERQKDFYNSFKKNKATKLWYALRNSLLRDIRKNIGAERQIYDLHKKWIGDLSGQKVLDLGCFAGNSLSYYLAENSNSYLGIDLSEPAIEKLNARLRNFPNAEAKTLDFLSKDFKEGDFDLIYAYGVLHHFRDTDELISRLKEKLKPEGRIISYDPLQTSIPVKIIRSVYRPFQSDKDWEWPFSKKVFKKYCDHFEIIDRKAIFGKTKWIFLLNLLPVSEKRKLKIGKKWHEEDWLRSGKSDKHLFKCMHLTMLMQNKTD